MYLHRQAERRFSGNPLHLKTVNITKVMIPVFVILVVGRSRYAAGNSGNLVLPD